MSSVVPEGDSNPYTPDRTFHAHVFWERCTFLGSCLDTWLARPSCKVERSPGTYGGQSKTWPVPPMPSGVQVVLVRDGMWTHDVIASKEVRILCRCPHAQTPACQLWNNLHSHTMPNLWSRSHKPVKPVNPHREMPCRDGRLAEKYDGRCQFVLVCVDGSAEEARRACERGFLVGFGECD